MQGIVGARPCKSDTTSFKVLRELVKISVLNVNVLTSIRKKFKCGDKFRLIQSLSSITEERTWVMLIACLFYNSKRQANSFRVNTIA